MKVTKEPQHPRTSLYRRKSDYSSKAEEIQKIETPRMAEKPKPVQKKKVATLEDDKRQQAVPGSSVSPLLSLHRKDNDNKGTSRKKLSEVAQERRRSSWEFFLETKKLRKLKKKKQAKESKFKLKHGWMKTTEKRVGRKSVRRLFNGLKNFIGLGNKKREKKKVTQNRELYPLDEFCTRSSKPFRMNVQ